MRDNSAFNIWLFRVTAILLVVMALSVAWLFFFDGVLSGPVVTFHSGCYETTQSTYHPGDSVYVHINLTKHRNITGQSLWMLTGPCDDGKEQLLVPIEGTMLRAPAGKLNHIYRLAVLPYDLPPGKWKLVGQISYAVNPFRTVVYPVESNEFTVLSNEAHSSDQTISYNNGSRRVVCRGR